MHALLGDPQTDWSILQEPKTPAVTSGTLATAMQSTAIARSPGNPDNSPRSKASSTICRGPAWLNGLAYAESKRPCSTLSPRCAKTDTSGNPTQDAT